jgi:hypothetical protein
MSVPKITKRELSKLKRNLPHGALSKIADEKNCSLMLVSLVLNGKSTDHKGIVVRAAELAAEHKAKLNNGAASSIIKSL